MMMIGGSTTSLLSILSRLDYDKYEVDLLLDTVSGPLLDMIPKEVDILKDSYVYPNHKRRKFMNLLSLKYMKAYIESLFIRYRSGNYKQGVQYIEMRDVEKYRRIDKHYDVAISFLEGKNCKFVANHVSADKKIGWIHIDYKASGFNPEYDRESMSKFDEIVTVSNNCRNSFCECFPELEHRTCVIENILSDKVIRYRASEQIDFSVDSTKLNLVTTCRIVFASKGLDRGVRAFATIRKKYDINKIRWYILGDGIDMPKLREMIKCLNLEQNIILLGNKTNPYPYLKRMDAFFLPSIWEGKPMAVTEAFMLGLPVIATNYLSATEQIDHGVDGIIMDNSETGIINGIEYVLTHPNKINEMRQNVVRKDYSNDSEMQRVISLIS